MPAPNNPKRYEVGIATVTYNHSGMSEGQYAYVYPSENGDYVLYTDYAELERRHQTIMEAIENMGSLENIRRIEVSQPIVIDMARENAWMKGIISRLIEAGDALVAILKDEGYQTELDPEDESNQGMSEVVAWNEAKRTKEYETIAMPKEGDA